jgi:cytochrome c
VDARVTDQAGNISTASIRLQIDTTAPKLVLSLSGTSGKNNWYVSNVTSEASVSDATSGMALTEYRVDAGVDRQ